MKISIAGVQYERRDDDPVRWWQRYPAGWFRCTRDDEWFALLDHAAALQAERDALRDAVREFFAAREALDLAIDAQINGDGAATSRMLAADRKLRALVAP